MRAVKPAALPLTKAGLSKFHASIGTIGRSFHVLSASRNGAVALHSRLTAPAI